MKSIPTMHSRLRSRHAAALLALVTLASSASADTFYWEGTSGNSSINTNWVTTAGGGTNPGSAPNSLNDDLVFNRTGQNGVNTVTLDANLAAKSLTVNSTGATTLEQNLSSRTLTIGTGGITVNAGAGAVRISTNATNPSMQVNVTGNQTWSNLSGNTLIVRLLRSATDAGPVALTLNAGTTAGAITFEQTISDTVDNPLSIVVDSAGSARVNMASSTYRGGTTINRGTLQTTGNLGTGSIQLGNTTGNANANFNVNSTGFTNNIIVRSGSAGVKTLSTINAAGVLSGSLTLNDNLALSASGSLTTFSGAISGTGDIVKSGTGALTFSGANTSSGDLTINTGGFTLAPTTGSLTFYIGADDVNNQVNGTTTGAVAFNGTFNLNLSGASLVDGNSWTLVSLASTVETYGTGFSLAGFTDTDEDNIWTNGSGLSYSELTGILSYSGAIPEPSTYAVLGGLAALFFASARRRTRS